jgi:hypothetical protein
MAVCRLECSWAIPLNGLAPRAGVSSCLLTRAGWRSLVRTALLMRNLGDPAVAATERVA